MALLAAGPAAGESSLLTSLGAAIETEDTSRYQFGKKHFLTGNEVQLALLARDAARRPGGAYLGVGAEQNYTLIASGKPRISFIVDTDPKVIELHRAYHALHKIASTRTAFLAYVFGRKPPAHRSADTMESLVRRIGQQGRLEVEAVLRHARGRVSEAEWQALSKLLQGGYGNKLTEHFAQAAGWPRSAEGFGCWLDGDATYATVRRNIQKGRVHLSVGSISGERTMRSIAALARRAGEVFHTIYLSNAPEYVIDAKQGHLLGLNLGMLPARGAHVLNTSSHSNLARVRPLASFGGDWSYYSAPLSAFVRGCPSPPHQPLSALKKSRNVSRLLDTLRAHPRERSTFDLGASLRRHLRAVAQPHAVRAHAH